jgi:hypothetical protein
MTDFVPAMTTPCCIWGFLPVAQNTRRPVASRLLDDCITERSLAKARWLRLVAAQIARGLSS